MKRSFWTRTKRQLRRALARARSTITGPRALSSQPLSHQISPYRSRRDWHVLTCKSFATEENATPDFEFCDFAMTTAAGTQKNWHTDHTNIFQYYEKLARRKPAERERGTEDVAPFVNLAAADAARALREKTKFCAFVFKNYQCMSRNRFLEILSAHMRVEAGGRTMRSVRHALGPRKVKDYPEAVATFYRPYKFVIAFENSLSLHYASEKIGAGIKARAVPIYWGNPLIANYFNPERFINAFDFDTLESLAAHVMRVHKDDALYLRYLSAPNRTSRQDAGEFTNCRYYVNLPDIARGFRTERKVFFGFYQRVTEKHRKGFLHQYIGLMTGRMLPLAQRRMFLRECLARFAHGECDRLVKERLKLAGVRSDLPQSGRHVTSHRRVWPHPAFYKVVDMDGRLEVKE